MKLLSALELELVLMPKERGESPNQKAYPSNEEW